MLKEDHLLPAQHVLSDHSVCSTKGCLFTSHGKTDPDSMYSGGCIFVDHASSHIHIAFQLHLNSHEMLHAKEQYEEFCHDHGVVAKSSALLALVLTTTMV